MSYKTTEPDEMTHEEMEALIPKCFVCNNPVYNGSYVTFAELCSLGCTSHYMNEKRRAEEQSKIDAMWYL